MTFGTVLHIPGMFYDILPSVADPHHFDADPDPAFHIDANPDPNPTCHSDADPDAFQFDTGFLHNLMYIAKS
jgi:hypothetical protein